jgi:hypothetical protein
MNWILPTPLLLVAGAAALVPLAFLLRRPVSGPRLMAEAFATTSDGRHPRQTPSCWGGDAPLMDRESGGGSLGIHAERCSREPWLGSGK